MFNWINYYTLGRAFFPSKGYFTDPLRNIDIEKEMELIRWRE